MKYGKLSVFLLTGLLVASIGSAAYGFQHPAWTTVNDDGAKAVSIINTNGTVTELPTFAEAYAYLDIESASAANKELILKARREIVYGETAWTVDGQVSIVNKDGTVEKLPEFKDLYPDWKLEELVLKNDSDIISIQSANFAGTVHIPKQSDRMGNEFYRFNAATTLTDTWAGTLPGSKFNVGYRNDDTNTDVGWIPNLEIGQRARLNGAVGVRFAVRCSTADTAGHGYIYVRGVN